MPDALHPSAMSIEQQHAAIITCCDELVAALLAVQPISDLALIRIRLAGLIHTNHAAEEAQINAPLRRLPIADRPLHFQRINADAANLRGQYSAHVGRWNLAAIAADTPGYTRDAKALVNQVKTHLADKRKVLSAWQRAIPAPSPGLAARDSYR